MKLVVVGCGIGGAEVVANVRKRLPKKELEICVLDQRANTQCKALHPLILSGRATPEEASGDLKRFAEAHDAEFINERVEDVDFDERLVKTEKGREVSYDHLVLAFGAEPDFSVPGAEGAHSIYTLEDAVRAKNALDALDFSKERDVVVVGAGLTGVEVAGELSDFFTRTGKKVKVTLVEKESRILPELPEEVSSFVANILKERGVEMLTSTKVTEISDAGVMLEDGRMLSSDFTLWAGGVKPHSLIKTIARVKRDPYLGEIGFPVTEDGWLRVEPFSRLMGMTSFDEVGEGEYKEYMVFAVGDAVKFEVVEPDFLEKVSMKTMDEAERHAKTVAKNIATVLKGWTKPLRHIYIPKNATVTPNVLIPMGEREGVEVRCGSAKRVSPREIRRKVKVRKVSAERVRKEVERGFKALFKE
ncbi:MAG: NADH dehydrogenase [Candidatus Alkanophagales archaeon MCA70_species_2]|nr:NADH dehydrogenase [Candidatus Alkanophaga liquidiphilum]